MVERKGRDELGLALRYAVLTSRDLEAARRFYLGVLGLRSTGEEDADFFQCACGGTEICVDLGAEEEHPRLVLEAPDLGVVAARLRAEGVVHRMVRGRSGASYLEVQDPDGHTIVVESAS
jgi:catechol 2,3-dioxygenase-like lactoylglutathione lyase family enzyme